MKQLLITAYHPQTNGQAKKFNTTIASKLRNYIADHKKDWDAYVDPLTPITFRRTGPEGLHRST